MRKRFVLAICTVVFVAVIIMLVPKLFLVYRSAEYVLGYANDPPGGPYMITFGTDRQDELRGGPEDDLLASEGPWGSPPEDYRVDHMDGGMGDDFLDSVSLPYPEKLPSDVIHCGSGEDRVVADIQDEVADDCEKVRRVNMGFLPEVGDPLPEFPPEIGTRQYGPSPYAERSLD